MAKPWRKEPNRWPDSPIRNYLDFEERDVYHCLRSYAGASDREGFVERSEGVPYSTEQLALRIEVEPEALQRTLAKLLDIEEVSVEGGIIHFLKWDDEQAIPAGKSRRRMSPEQKEAYDHFTAESYATNHPEFLQSKVDQRIITLANEGKIEVKEGGGEDV